MKWYKHDSDAITDAKIRKLVIRYGPTGYAIYFHCLELISGSVDENNITFELEHDSEIIADNLKVPSTQQQSSIEIVEEVMRYIIDLKLFESVDNRIFCFKLLKRLDSSMTSNKKMRELIVSARQSHDSVMIGSCKKRGEEKRKEEETENQTRLRETLISKKQNVLKLMPHVESVYDIEAEQMIAHYKSKNIGVDPYAKVINWFKRIEKPKVEVSATQGNGDTQAEADRIKKEYNL